MHDDAARIAGVERVEDGEGVQPHVLDGRLAGSAAIAAVVEHGDIRAARSQHRQQGVQVLVEVEHVAAKVDERTACARLLEQDPIQCDAIRCPHRQVFHPFDGHPFIRRPAGRIGPDELAFRHPHLHAARQ
nr:hypothetical protein [Massilia sp. Dwa41.01b]